MGIDRTHEGHGVVAPGSYDAEPLHHSVLHQSLGIRLQGLDGYVLNQEKKKHFSFYHV